MLRHAFSSLLPRSTSSQPVYTCLHLLRSSHGPPDQTEADVKEADNTSSSKANPVQHAELNADAGRKAAQGYDEGQSITEQEAAAQSGATGKLPNMKGELYDREDLRYAAKATEEAQGGTPSTGYSEEVSGEKDRAHAQATEAQQMVGLDDDEEAAGVKDTGT